MMPLFWIFGPLLRIPVWITCVAAGIVYGVICGLLAAINAGLRALCLAIRERQLERGAP